MPTVSQTKILLGAAAGILVVGGITVYQMANADYLPQKDDCNQPKQDLVLDATLIEAHDGTIYESLQDPVVLYQPNKTYRGFIKYDGELYQYLNKADGIPTTPYKVFKLKSGWANADSKPLASINPSETNIIQAGPYQNSFYIIKAKTSYTHVAQCQGKSDVLKFQDTYYTTSRLITGGNLVQMAESYTTVNPIIDRGDNQLSDAAKLTNIQKTAIAQALINKNIVLAAEYYPSGINSSNLSTQTAEKLATLIPTSGYQYLLNTYPDTILYPKPTPTPTTPSSPSPTTTPTPTPATSYSPTATPTPATPSSPSPATTPAPKATLKEATTNKETVSTTSNFTVYRNSPLILSGIGPVNTVIVITIHSSDEHQFETTTNDDGSWSLFVPEDQVNTLKVGSHTVTLAAKTNEGTLESATQIGDFSVAEGTSATPTSNSATTKNNQSRLVAYILGAFAILALAGLALMRFLRKKIK